MSRRIKVGEESNKLITVKRFVLLLLSVVKSPGSVRMQANWFFSVPDPALRLIHRSAS